MTAADVYATLGIKPLPAAGLAWAGLKPYERQSALWRQCLPRSYSRDGWRDLPRRIKTRLTDAHATRHAQR